VSDLERALLALGRDLDVPEVPDVLPAVLDALKSRERPRALRRRWALAVAIVALAVLTAALAVPEARSALFRVLHIGGERIELVDELPEVAPDPAGLDFEQQLGERVSLAAARRQAGFDLRELENPPDRVYLGLRGTVWYLYGEPSDVRLLVAQTRQLTLDADLLSKKLVGPGTSVEVVLVDGMVGFYISGTPHLMVFLDEQGHAVEESVRLARNVLVWEEEGVAIRLEGAFTRERALELAESLR
jgi:hypothetical protein